MPDHVLSIDAGTTSVRVLIVGADGAVRAKTRETLPIHYPAPGRVEQDAEHIWRTTELLITAALSQAGIAARDIAAIGITSQRSSCVVWDRATANPESPLVSWQDLRGVDTAATLRREGFEIFPQAAAAKLPAVLDAVSNGRRRAADGALAWGNIDSFLVYKLSAGAQHITDPSQACATGYFDYAIGGWAARLLEIQTLPASFFPALVDSAGQLAEADSAVFGATVPIAAILGDQQSAALAQQCREPGDGKVTYGTSGTANIHTGHEIASAPGAYPLVLRRKNGVTDYCLEGMVITAGAVFDWLAGGLGLLDDPAEVQRVGEEASDTGGVYVLPALQGLGSPHADPERRGLIVGLSRGTRKEHLVRATLEGIAFRVREMLDAIYAGAHLTTPSQLRADGGAAANDLLLQLQADILGRPVERMAPLEATAYGAAIEAGKAAGLWSEQDTAGFRHVDGVFEPRGSKDEQELRYAAWRQACRLS